MKPLKISDKIYGRFTVTEPVLIELIKSKPLRRLKGIDNRGAWAFHYSSPGSLSRYDHSLGVMLLLKKFCADPEEQIAGLLHDVSHTAFSHVADFVFNSNYLRHDYQDKKLAQAFELQGINKILKIKPTDFLKNLVIRKNKFVFVKQSWAKKFGLLYLEFNQKLWCCPLE